MIPLMLAEILVFFFLGCLLEREIARTREVRSRMEALLVEASRQWFGLRSILRIYSNESVG